MGYVIACPQGHAPERTKQTKNHHRALFNSAVCQTCPRVNDCPDKPGVRGHTLRYDHKAVRLAKRRADEKTPAFKEKYRYRSRIEATMSEYDRRTGVKHLRVRGLSAVSFCATLKAAAVNIFCATAFRNRIEREKPAPEPGKAGISDLLHSFKEQISNTIATVWQWCRPLGPSSTVSAQFAA